MRNILKLLQVGSFGLVLLAGLTSAASGAIRNTRALGARMTAELTWAHVKVSNSATLQESPAAKALTQEQYQSELAKLDALERAKDLDGLERVGDDLEKTWGRAGGQYYGLIMLEISNLLENHFSGAGIYATSQKYILGALAKADSFPLGLEIRLLDFLSRDIALTDSNDTAVWIRERRTKARLWLHAWHRLESQINRNFNFSDRPTLNVTPPAESGLPSGVTPEAIKDLKLRAEYQALIAANTAKAREYNRQFNLRYLDSFFPKRAEDYLVRAYSKPPHRFGELRTYLTYYGLRTEIRERVLNRITRNQS